VTALAADHDSAGHPSGAARRRLRALLVNEVRLLRRFGVFTATAVITVLWSAILLAVPPAARQVLVPLILLTDVTALGFLFVPALLVLERMERVELALRMTPVRTFERVGVRVGVTTALAVLSAIAVLLVGDAPNIPVAVVGVAGASVLVGLVAVAAIGSAATLTTFLLRAPLFAGPLMAPALVAAIGLVDTPLLHISPLTGALDMMRGHLTLAGLLWLLVWIIGTALLAGHNGRAIPGLPHGRRGLPLRYSRRAPRAAPGWPVHTGSYQRWTAIGSFARVDRRSLVRDGLLIMLAVSVPLVALAGRLIGTVGVTWARQRHGIDLVGYLPVVWVILLVVHTPVIFGSVTGLLLLEDRDAGLLPAIATTRASTATLLGYRLAATAICTAVGLGIALPLAGARHPAGVIGVLAVIAGAAALSTVPAALMAALAANRVQGVAVMKMLGLPLYLPVASFFAEGSLRWVFAPLPSSWLMWSLWTSGPAGAVGFAAAAAALSALVTSVLWRRLVRDPLRG
jgi:hypothetical protein